MHTHTPKEHTHTIPHSTTVSAGKSELCSAHLALKRQPLAIRFQKSSPLAKQLVEDVQEHILSDQIFHFRREGRGSESCNYM